jgi:hypothetical protein
MQSIVRREKLKILRWERHVYKIEKEEIYKIFWFESILKDGHPKHWEQVRITNIKFIFGI